MADAIFPSARLAMIQGDTPLTNNFAWVNPNQTVRLLLLKPSYVYDPTDKFVADLTPASNEVAGVGYSRKDVGGRTATLITDTVSCDANDPTIYPAATGWTAAAAVLYRFVSGDADSPLISFHDCAVTANGGDVALQFSSSPAAVFTVS